MENKSKTYTERHIELVTEESGISWDIPARESASLAELKAQEIIFNIRESERRDPALYGNLPGEALPRPEARDLGGHFLTNIREIERSKIFKIAKAMPKGAHHHVHFKCELQPERLLLRAREPEVVKTFCIRSTVLLCNEQAFKDAEIVFQIVPGYYPKV